MRKVELTERETATLISCVEVKIEGAVYQRNETKRLIKSGDRSDIARATLEYWTQYEHALRQLKAKLEREETEGGDG